MPFRFPRFELSRILFYSRSFAIATLGGAVFTLIGIPAGWLSGSIAAVALASLLGGRMGASEFLHWPVFVLLGVQIGSGVNEQAVQAMVTWPLSLLVMALSVIMVQLGSQVFLERVCGWRRDTAFYASVPGSMTYAIALAATTYSDMRQVVLTQSLRMVLLVLLLPSVIVNLEDAAPGALPVQPHDPVELAILIAVATVAGIGSTWLRIPAGPLMGAMAASAVLHGTGLIHSGLPNWILVPCFLYIGCMAGSRFNGTDFRLLRSILGGALGSFVVVCVIAMIFAMADSFMTGIPIGQTMLAFAPGGLEAMALMAFVLGLDAAFVAVHHVIRLVTITATLPFLAKSPVGGGNLGPPKE